MKRFTYEVSVERCNDLVHPTQPTPEEFRVGKTTYESNKYVADGQYKKSLNTMEDGSKLHSTSNN